MTDHTWLNMILFPDPADLPWSVGTSAPLTHWTGRIRMIDDVPTLCFKPPRAPRRLARRAHHRGVKRGRG